MSFRFRTSRFSIDRRQRECVAAIIEVDIRWLSGGGCRSRVRDRDRSFCVGAECFPEPEGRCQCQLAGAVKFGICLDEGLQRFREMLDNTNLSRTQLSARLAVLQQLVVGAHDGHDMSMGRLLARKLGQYRDQADLGEVLWELGHW